MSESVGFVIGGRAFDGTLFRPLGTPRAAALVFHGGGGPMDHERRVAQTLADLGYAAYVPDLFGETFVDRAHCMSVIGALVGDPETLRSRAKAALAQLTAAVSDVPAGVAVGHCFGGLVALELARSGADLRAAVSLHGGLHTRAPATPGAVRARVLACTGAEDPFCPPDQRAAFEAEMTAAGVDWQHHVHGGARHGFSVAGIPVSDGIAYHEPSARRSWDATIRLLDESTSPPNFS